MTHNKIDSIVQIKDKNERNEMLLDLIMAEDNSFPMDKSMKLIINKFPEENHEELELPGVYSKPGEKNYIDSYNNVLSMDQVSLVYPDDEISQKSVENTEYQSKPPATPKKGKIFSYRVSMTSKYKFNPISSIVGNFNGKYKRKEIFTANEHAYSVFVSDYNDSKVREKLNMIRNISNSNKEFSINEALHIGYVSIYASKDIAKEVIDESVNLFAKTNIDNSDLNLTIFRVLNNMIKHRFRDDETKARELIKMNIETLTEQDINELPHFSNMERAIMEEKEFNKKLQDMIRKKEDVIAENEKALAEKEDVIAENEKVITEKEDVIAENEKVITENEKLINKLKAEIEQLKKNNGNSK